MTGTDQAVRLRPAEPVGLAKLVSLTPNEFRRCVIRAVDSGSRLVALFGRRANAGSLRLHALTADGRTGGLACVSTQAGDSYQSLTPDCPAAHYFERELAETWGVRPLGHPWLKPVRFPRAASCNGNVLPPPEAHPFFQMHGEEIHEVAVGPVHAGIIEPGHFRFQCHGENVFHLEISLGYQHRGVERAMLGGAHKRAIHYMETLAGDTTVGHATAYCDAVEALAGCQVPPRALVVRGIGLELERLANHTGGLGAMAGDVGYLPTASFCGRIRGDFLNMTALICGNRFGRGLIRPGGVGFDMDEDRTKELSRRLDAARKDVEVAVNLLWNTPSVMARFEGIGTVSLETARAVGLVGVAARACGIERDVRQEFPGGIYRFAQIPVSTASAGDVFARAYVRWLEIQRSLSFVMEQLQSLPDGPIATPCGCMAADTMAVSLVEGWRGEICHVVMTDPAGHFAAYKVVDPSFHNWFGLAMALRDQQISDFPLCNKSFDLSYCGHDL